MLTNSEKLRIFMRVKKFTAEQVAEILSRLTGDSVSVHTVYKWVSPPDVKGARKCPGWVIRVLGL